MNRRLHVAPDVATELPSYAIAQFEAQVNDADNVCAVCHRAIDTDVVNLVVVHDPHGNDGAGYQSAVLAHPNCHRSRVVLQPGAWSRQQEQGRDGDTSEVTSAWTFRSGEAPHAVLLQEFRRILAHNVDLGDPIEHRATVWGLTPVTGGLDSLSPPQTTQGQVRIKVDGSLELALQHGTERVAAPPEQWCHTARTEGAVLLILGRGLHLDQPDLDKISEALCTQPCYGAVLAARAS